MSTHIGSHGCGALLLPKAAISIGRRHFYWMPTSQQSGFGRVGTRHPIAPKESLSRADSQYRYTLKIEYPNHSG